MQENDLITAGMVGGLAAAFDAPLAGVVSAIEELRRGVILRWERQVLMGVLAVGFVRVAIQGNSPYFSGFQGRELPGMLMWAAMSDVVCDVAGELFGGLLYHGATAFVPVCWRSFIHRHLLVAAFVAGTLLALFGTFYWGKTYGTGYHEVAAVPKGVYEASFDSTVAKWAVTVFSYWAGIPGDILAPSLAVDVMIGGHVTSFAQLGDTSNVTVLLCMAAFLAAAAQSPLAIAVVVIEVMGGQNLLFWMLLTCTLASQVSRQLSPYPFYHAAGLRFRRHIETKSGHVPREKKE